MAVHPSGGVIATGQAGAIRVWSLASLQTLALLGSSGVHGGGGHGGGGGGEPSVVAFSPDGTVLLSLVPPPDPFASPGAKAAFAAAAAAARDEADDDATAASAREEARRLLDPPLDPPSEGEGGQLAAGGGYAHDGTDRDAGGLPLPPQPSILAAWAWSGGHGARRLASGAVHVAAPLAQARAHTLPSLCACFLPAAGLTSEEEAAVAGGGHGGGRGGRSFRLASAGVRHGRYGRQEGARLVLECEPPASREAEWGAATSGCVHLSCCALAATAFFGCDNGSLLLLSAHSGALLRRIDGAHHGPLRALRALAPLDGSPGAAAAAALASGGADGRIRLWSAGGAPCGEWRLSRSVDAMRDARGRPFDLGGGGDGAGSASVRGLSWAGPRGAVVQAGRACLTIAPDNAPDGLATTAQLGGGGSGNTMLCFVALPVPSRRSSLACTVVRATPLPDAEARFVEAAHPDQSSGRSPVDMPASSTAVGPPHLGPFAKVAPLYVHTPAAADGWGADDDDDLLEGAGGGYADDWGADDGANDDGGIHPPAQPAMAAGGRPTAATGGWLADGATSAAADNLVVASGASISHEALAWAY